jgi:Tfp pilus assembly protein PilF
LNVTAKTHPLRSVILAATMAALCAGARTAATQEGPEDIDSRVSRAVSLHQQGDILGAIDAYQAILADAPERADVRSNLGAAYVRLGRIEEAIAQYRQALVDHAGDPAIRFNLGLALHKTARFGEAKLELAKVVEQQPGNHSALLLLAECHLQLEEYRNVIERLSPVAEEHRDERAFAYLLGTALVREGDLARGQVWIDRMLSGGDSAETRLLMGAAQIRAGNLAEAKEELLRAAELDPTLPRVHSLLGHVLVQTADPEGARQAFRAELQNNPNDFDANLYLGSLRRDEGRLDEAQAYLRRAVRIRGDDPTCLHALGSLYLSMGELEKARETLEATVSVAPDFEEAHVFLAMAYFRLGRREDAARERVIARELADKRRTENQGARDDGSPDAAPMPPPGDPAPREESRP